MADVTTAERPVPQAPLSPQQRIEAFLGGQEEPADDEPQAAEQPSAAQPEDVAQSTDSQAQEPGELTPDDIPDEAGPAPQQSLEAFEIVHNGTQHKLSREDAIRYAQQGFDYTQKTQALAEHARQVEERFQRVTAIEQAQPLLQQAAAQVQAVAAQLQPYAQVDWVKLATDDPLEYPKHRARFDQLQAAYGSAMGQYNQAQQAVEQQKQVLTAQQLQQERTRMLEQHPEWRDPDKFATVAKEMSSYLLKEGATPEEVNAINGHVAVNVIWKAAQYDKLLAAKNGKVKLMQNAPPVQRPGAVQSRDAASADKETKLRGQLRKSGSLDAAAALLLNRMK